MTIKYSTTVRDGIWHETGERIMPGREPMRIFDMTLKRVGATS